MLMYNKNHIIDTEKHDQQKLTTNHPLNCPTCIKEGKHGNILCLIQIFILETYFIVMYQLPNGVWNYSYCGVKEHVHYNSAKTQ